MGEKPRILVIGDVMLDKHWFGSVDRISPEAPVPIVKITRQEARLGGAGNTANNINTLGGTATLIGITGIDDAAKEVEKLASLAKIQTNLHALPNIPTTVKLRIIGSRQQMLRVDFEEKPENEWLKSRDMIFANQCAEYSVVVLSDYGKGVLRNPENLIQVANKMCKPIIVDPKGRDWSIYKNATVITPNRNELRDVIGDWEDEKELETKVTALRTTFNIDNILLTRSEDGMTLFNAQGRYHIPTKAQEVFDVSGAGDTVVAALAVYLAEGKTISQAAQFANFAGGIAVSKVGVATVTREEIAKKNNLDLEKIGL